MWKINLLKFILKKKRVMGSGWISFEENGKVTVFVILGLQGIKTENWMGVIKVWTSGIWQVDTSKVINWFCLILLLISDKLDYLYHEGSELFKIWLFAC